MNEVRRGQSKWGSNAELHAGSGQGKALELMGQRESVGPKAQKMRVAKAPTSASLVAKGPKLSGIFRTVTTRELAFVVHIFYKERSVFSQ